MAIGIVRVADEVAAKTNMTKAAAKEAVRATLEAIVELSLEDTVSLPPLGKFKVKQRAEREARNPATGEKILVAAKEVLTFKPASSEVERPKKKAPAAKSAKAAPAKPAAKAAPAKGKGGRRR